MLLRQPPASHRSHASSHTVQGLTRIRQVGDRAGLPQASAARSIVHAESYRYARPGTRGHAVDRVRLKTPALDAAYGRELEGAIAATANHVDFLRQAINANQDAQFDIAADAMGAFTARIDWRWRLQ